LKTEHVDPEVLAQEEIEMEQRRLAAIQAQQRYNAGYDNSFAGVYEDSFDETAEVAAVFPPTSNVKLGLCHPAV
jgi:hypothetical protein